MTQPKTPPSLRDQIIDAMEAHPDWIFYQGELLVPTTAAAMFDEAIMPVLQKAMDAGELLVGRNTKDRTPVHQGIVAWLELVTAHVTMIQMNEATISKRKALEVIYQFGEQASRALHEARIHNDRLKQGVH
jgi:hypothetical protein